MIAAVFLIIGVTITLSLVVLAVKSYNNRELLHIERMAELRYNHIQKMAEFGFQVNEQDDVLELQELAEDLAEDPDMLMDDTEDEEGDEDEGEDGRYDK